jgi:SAM-dependent methyltransferase
VTEDQRAAPTPAFNCLWCGRPHQPRTADDIEAHARLCPECIGRAQDNEFLRFRLREGLRARAEAARGDVASDTAAMKAYYSARASEYDETYAGLGWDPLQRAVFLADLDAATLWLDRLPWRGEIVELAAGTGWWSPLLAQKGELSLYDVSEDVLERARQRLLAHGLRAHIHVRDAWAEPDRQVDGLFTGLWLSHVRQPRLGEFLALCRRWLRPGGLYALLDEAPGLDYTPTAGGMQQRRLNDGREFGIPKAYHAPADLERALRDAGFSEVEVTTTSRHFVLGRAVA